MSDIQPKITVRRDNVQRRMDILELRIARAARSGDYLQVEMVTREWSRLNELRRQMRQSLIQAGWSPV